MDYKEYAAAQNADKKVLSWISSNLANYLTSHPQNQDEIEHVIDYLVQNTNKNLEKMSYEEAVKNATAWTNIQIKKGEHIKESPDDTTLILDFKDGFKIVQLIGKNAYEREGYLMRHCAASYYGTSRIIYSLRDKDNMPHCTIEQDQQIKGKGNGNIHPKYVGYIVKFLEHIGMSVGDSEMKHLGYINVAKVKKYLSKKTNYFNNVYVPEDEQLLDTEEKEFASLDLLDTKPLIKESLTNELTINFRLEQFIKLSIEFMFKYAKKKDTSTQAASGGYSQLAASGDSSKLAASGDFSQLAASGDYSKLAASGDYSQLAASGDYSQLAASGDSSQLAINGKESVGANIGIGGRIKGKIGNWITLAEYKDNKPVCVKSVKIDGKKIKEDTWYILENKQFTEIE